MQINGTHYTPPVVSQIMKHLEDQNILSDRPTIVSHNYSLPSMTLPKENLQEDAAILDFSKAFDKVSYPNFFTN